MEPTTVSASASCCFVSFVRGWLCLLTATLGSCLSAETRDLCSSVFIRGSLRIFLTKTRRWLCIEKYPEKYAGKYRQRCLQSCRDLRGYMYLYLYLHLYLNLNPKLHAELNREKFEKSFQQLFRKFLASLFGLLFDLKYRQL
jgi:hypothetical protein